MKLEPGCSMTVETVVDEDNLASAVGSGLVDVFATPAMIAQMELAASGAVQPALLEGQTTVGAGIDVVHNAASPLGMRICTTATVTAVDGRRIDFLVSCRDEVEEVGRGTHTRFVVEHRRFMQRAQDKAKKG